MLRTVLVDDELLARDMLAALLAQHADVEIVATCKSADEAIAVLRGTACDILFLDVQMPRKNGFSVIEETGIERMPAIVFVTAFHEHAVRAFEVQAVDYLTKPTNAKRLQGALERVRQRLHSGTGITRDQLASLLSSFQDQLTPKQTSLERILVKDGDHEVLLPVSQIEWIEAAAYYSSLHCKGRVYMHRQTMAELEAALEPSRFVRVHRKAIVNLDFVSEVFREGRSGNVLRLRNGASVPISQSGLRQLEQTVAAKNESWTKCAARRDQ